MMNYATQLRNPQFCHSMMFIFAQYLLGPSNVPPACAPLTTPHVLSVCETSINHLLENPATSDIHSMLSTHIGLHGAQELAAVLTAAYEAAAANSDYWARITSTFALALVVEAKSQRLNQQYFRMVDMALKYYRTAVKYAIVIDEDRNRSNQIGLLNRHLGDARAVLESCIVDPIVVPDRVTGTQLRMASVGLEDMEEIDDPISSS